MVCSIVSEASILENKVALTESLQDRGSPHDGEDHGEDVEAAEPLHNGIYHNTMHLLFACILRAQACTIVGLKHSI